jgi:hypothetical protein
MLRPIKFTVLGEKMTTLSAVATNLRTVAAASAIAAAATLMPAAVANATPSVPVPLAGVGSSLGSTIAPCDPNDEVCALAAPGSNGPLQNPLVWFGPSNPNFQPLFGIVFPNIFGLDFEGCLLGGAVHLSPYSGGFVGLGLGC